MAKRKNKTLIDFNQLSNHELIQLSKKWEIAARKLEQNIELELKNSNNLKKDVKLTKLWKTSNSLWRRVYILDKWMSKNLSKRK